jgi:hypothetical protein
LKRYSFKLFFEMFRSITFLSFAVCLLWSGAADAKSCILGNALSLSREFSLPRNSICMIRKAPIPGRRLVPIRIVTHPRLGRFGKASLSELAYKAGNRTGDDYFEYISTEIIAGIKNEYRVRNIVHITQ